MTKFFDWIGEVTPMILWALIWVLVAPVRIVILLCLPTNAHKRYHWANAVHEFVAFEWR
jgi:hypothetical protein